MLQLQVGRRYAEAKRDDVDAILDDIKDEMGKANATIGEVEDAYASANETLINVTTKANDTINTFLEGLQKAKTIANGPMGRALGDAASTISDLVDQATESITDIQDQVESAIETAWGRLEEEYGKLEDYKDDLMEKVNKTIEDTEKCFDNGTSLLQYGANQSGQFWPFSRKKGCGSPCKCASETITTANDTVASFGDTLDQVISTINETLYGAVEDATGGVDDFIDQIADSIEEGGSVPAMLKGPLNSAIDQLKAVKENCVSSLGDSLPDVMKVLTDSKEKLEAFYPLMDKLQEKINSS